MGLAILILGLVIFVANHVFTVFRGTRAALIARLGKRIYYPLYGVISLVGVAVIVWGFADYRSGEWVQIWSPPVFMHHITVGLMLIVCILLVATFIPSHIKARTKYPLLAAVVVWAFAHLLANGDLGGIVMFGTLFVWAVYARIAAEYRTDVVLPAVPKTWRGDMLTVIVGVGLYLALGFWFHPQVIGLTVFTS